MVNARTVTPMTGVNSIKGSSVFSRKGFSLVELLVVVAIISVLAALLFPVYVTAKESANKQMCLSNLQQLGMAMFLYMDNSNGRLCPSLRKEEGEFISWDTAIRQYVKNTGVYKCPSDGGRRPAGLPRSYGMNDQWARYNSDHGIKPPYGKGILLSSVPKITRYVLLCDMYKASDGLNFLGSSGCVICADPPTEGFHIIDNGNNYLFFDGHAKFYKQGMIKSDRPNYKHSLEEQFYFDPK